MDIKVRTVEVRLTNDHLRLMVDSHRLQPEERQDPDKLARATQNLLDQALGLPEAIWHEWDDWGKGLE